MSAHPISIAPRLAVEELARRYRQAPNPRMARRWHAIWLRAQGHSPGEVTALLGVHIETLRQWVKRYNAEGSEGLEPRPMSGRPSWLTPAQHEELRVMLRQAPPHAPLWTGRLVVPEIERRFGVRYSLKQALQLMPRLGFRRVVPRPRHPQADAVAQETFKKNVCRAT